jgi:hypothetical protein
MSYNECIYLTVTLQHDRSFNREIVFKRLIENLSYGTVTFRGEFKASDVRHRISKTEYFTIIFGIMPAICCQFFPRDCEASVQDILFNLGCFLILWNTHELI